MASKTFNQSRTMNFEVNPSPETMYHFPISPSEPGKFDFYRVHLANQSHCSNPIYSDHSDAPILSASTTSSSIGTRRWTPFADIVSSDQTKNSILPNSLSSSNSKPQTVSSIDSSVLSNTNGIKNESIQTVSSFSSLTDAVKNAMNKKQFDIPSKQIRRPASGTTLSTKDLNHLSPQSM